MECPPVCMLERQTCSLSHVYRNSTDQLSQQHTKPVHASVGTDTPLILKHHPFHAHKLSCFSIREGRGHHNGVVMGYVAHYIINQAHYYQHFSIQISEHLKI